VTSGCKTAPINHVSSRCAPQTFPLWHWKVSFLCWIQSSVVAAHCLDM